jgi:Protein of unknown function (DUF1566)
MKTIQKIFIFILFVSICLDAKEASLSYRIVDTGVTDSYNNNSVIHTPQSNEKYFGQDSNYQINKHSYTDNRDGTVSDNITGLMWQKTMESKLSYKEALQKVKSINLGGHDDWRVPSIKELYSLILFTGKVKGQKAISPFINIEYFDQPLGNSSIGEREIDAQTWSATEYVGRTMRNDETVFGVNFVDGRIKGYPKYNPRTHQVNKMYFRFVRGNTAYGINSFSDNRDGTVTDNATGLMWQQADSLKGMNWQNALKYAQNLKQGGHGDWRVPNAKELQSIVDYSRSPDTTSSPAINNIFKTTSIRNEAGKKDYPYFWSSTTHLDGRTPEANAIYIAFGRALGKMHGRIMDVHGSGAQRSDPKTGTSMSRGPQGDMIRVKNYVRCVRGGLSGQISIDINKEINLKTEQDLKKKISHSTSSNRFVNRLDRDSDSKVSKAEFDGPKNRFEDFDKNSDGYITADEAPKGPPPNSGRRQR